MKKRVILSEAQLHRVINEAVKMVLKEEKVVDDVNHGEQDMKLVESKTEIIVKGSISSVHTIARKLHNYENYEKKNIPTYYGGIVLFFYYNSYNSALRDLKRAWDSIEETESITDNDGFDERTGTLIYDAAIARIYTSEVD